MGHYKQLPKSQFDQVTYDILKVNADDYRRKVKLMEMREKTGIDKVKEQVKKLMDIKKQREFEIEKAKRKGEQPDPSLMEKDGSGDPDMDHLVRRMQQQMMLIKAQVVQGMHDGYQKILRTQMETTERIVNELAQNVNTMVHLQELQKTQVQTQQ